MILYHFHPEKSSDNSLLNEAIDCTHIQLHYSGVSNDEKHPTISKYLQGVNVRPERNCIALEEKDDPLMK